MSTFSVAADTFFLPDGPAHGGYLVVADGAFREHAATPRGERVLDYTGFSVAPGFVDTHVHGFLGHDVMDSDSAGAVRAISEALPRTGVTSWLPTTLSAPTEQLEEVCAGVARAMDGTQRGATARGIFLEGPFFTQEHKGAQNPAYLCAPDVEKLRRWQRAAGGRVTKIAIAPEYPESPDFVREATRLGVVVGLGHSSATFCQARECLDAGAREFIHVYNGMSGLHHREPGMVGAALTSDESFVELICDGHHVHPRSAEVVIRLLGWEKVALVTDCMRAGGMPDGDYVLGELPVEVSGGAARLKGQTSLAGSVLELSQAVRNVVSWGLASPAQAIAMASAVPAAANGLDRECGSISPGRDADFVVLDHDLEVVATYVRGTCSYDAKNGA